MKKKCMVLFLSLSMVLTLFVGCSDSKDSEKQLQKVTLNEVAHSIFYAPMYVAIEKDANDKIVNFAQLTQRAGNFLVAREEMPDFRWEDLKGRKVLGGRSGD